MPRHRLAALGASLFITSATAMTSYANVFFSPESVLHSESVANAAWAQARVKEDAQWIARQGPWTVTSKSMLPPSNNFHDYTSYRPYYWPDCSNVGNTTQLTNEQSKSPYLASFPRSAHPILHSVYTICPYVRRDGEFNPDVRMINDTGAFSAMTDSIFYNSLAWSITNQSTYAVNVVSAISTWFLDPDTRMNPNLNYAQLLRGPDGPKGSSVGVLDLKCMSKLVSGVLLLRKGGAPEWTAVMDDGLNQWSREYITWLTTNSLALEEKAAENNHGTFYFNQVASLQLLVGNISAARSTIEEYFVGPYQAQIASNGDQPLESARTRPQHYRAYNLAAMVVNAKLGVYLGITDAWNRTAKSGAGIKDAADYAMMMATTATKEEDAELELLQPLAAVATAYGDLDGKYAAFLKSKDDQYPSRGYYLLATGLGDSGLTQTQLQTSPTSLFSTSGSTHVSHATEVAAPSRTTTTTPTTLSNTATTAVTRDDVRRSLVVVITLSVVSLSMF